MGIGVRTVEGSRKGPAGDAPTPQPDYSIEALRRRRHGFLCVVAVPRLLVPAHGPVPRDVARVRGSDVHTASPVGQPFAGEAAPLGPRGGAERLAEHPHARVNGRGVPQTHHDPVPGQCALERRVQALLCALAHRASHSEGVLHRQLRPWRRSGAAAAGPRVCAELQPHLQKLGNKFDAKHGAEAAVRLLPGTDRRLRRSEVHQTPSHAAASRSSFGRRSLARPQSTGLECAWRPFWWSTGSPS